MKTWLLLISFIRQKRAALSALLAKRWKSSFYFYLAALFTLFTVADAAFLHATAEMRQAYLGASQKRRATSKKRKPA